MNGPFPDLRTAARALNGNVVNQQIVCPGPGHSVRDRSLSVKPDPSAPGGYIVHSFAGDDPLVCRDHVADKLGLPKWEPGGSSSDILNRMSERIRQARNGSGNSGSAAGEKSKVIAEYVYRDKGGNPHTKVLRTDPKGFPQMQWTGSGWSKGKPPGDKIPYRLPELLAASDKPVFVVEGEKDADNLASLGFIATSSSEGVGGWTPELGQWFKGRVVYVLPDRDKPGRAHARQVAENLHGVAAEVRIVELPGLPEKGDVSDWLEAGNDPGGLEALCLEAPVYAPGAASEESRDEPEGSPEGDGSAWDTPDLTLLGNGRRPAPEFPLDLLGQFWEPWVRVRAGSASAPPDYVATPLLACVGAMLANVRWPVAGASWSEPPVLWHAEVGSPSSGKSPGMDVVFDLVRHAEDRMALGFDRAQLLHETAKQTAKAKREEWEAAVKAAVKSGESPPQMPDDAGPPAEPVRPRVRVADITVEKQAALAASLPRGLLIVRDELAGWLGAFDRYGGGGSDRAFAIEMYGGRSYVVDRVKNPEPIRIRHLSVGVLGGIQPDKLPEIIGGPDDGLASRLLWSWPDALPEFSLSRALADDTDARAAFGRLADLAMGSDEAGVPEPKRLRLSAEAENVIEAFARDIAKRANEASGIFAGALGKARGHALRLGCVLEHLWWCPVSGGSEPTSISAKAVEAAAGLLDAYFIPMAERVFGDASLPAAERAAMALARCLKRNGLTAFNARDVRREIGGALREAKAMDEACAILVEAGLIRPRFTRAGEAKGRAAKNYEVNPRIFGGKP